MDHAVSESELLQASLAGSREAFGEVVRRYQSLVCVLLAAALAVVNLRWTAWMDAYRRSTHYDRAQDFRLTTINLIVLGVFAGLFVLLAVRHFAARTARKEAPPGDEE